MPLKDRKKTTMWFDPELWSRVKDFSGEMGVSATAFCHLAVGHFLAAMAPASGSGVKRRSMVKTARKSFEAVISKAEESL
jgi:hypothetical protein